MENQELVKYQTLTGQEVQLTPAIVRKYLVNGEGKVTDQEIMMFMALCKYQNLNPFLREAYLIKYGSEKATMVTGKETFLKRAVKNPRYKGHETGISEDGKKAWAKIYIEGYQVPISIEVDFDEYAGKKGDGSLNKMWREKGKTMLKKVALVQALREAFPEDFGGMYSPEEINHIRELPENTINMPVDDKPPITPPQSKSEKKPEAPEVGTETIVTGIEKVTMKTGLKDGKAWTKYTIHADKEYSTFSETIATDAKKAAEAGLSAAIEYKNTPYGDKVYANIVSLKVIEPEIERIPGEEG